MPVDRNAFDENKKKRISSINSCLNPEAVAFSLLEQSAIIKSCLGFSLSRNRVFLKRLRHQKQNREEETVEEEQQSYYQFIVIVYS